MQKVNSPENALVVALKKDIKTDTIDNKNIFEYLNMKATPEFAEYEKNFTKITDNGTYNMQNAKNDTKPAIAPIIIPSLIVVCSKQSYFISSHITSGAMKNNAKIKDIVPI